MGLKLPEWKISVTVSVLIHLLVVLLIFLAPVAKKPPEKPLVAKLMTPDEWMKQFPERSSAPSEEPPKKLYGSARGRSLPGPASPRAVKPQRMVPSTPAPLPVQPQPKAPERPVTPDTSAGSMADHLPSTQGKTDNGAVQKKDMTGNLPGGSGIPAPAASLKPGGKFNPFDPEVVGKIIAKNEGKTHDNSITFDAGEFRYEGYMNKLKEKIESIWRYPQDAARRGIKGDLKIRFTISKNGRLEDVEVVRTSGYRVLDEAAVQALKEGDPFWPLPEDWGKDSLTITGHFIYSLYGQYIR